MGPRVQLNLPPTEVASVDRAVTAVDRHASTTVNDRDRDWLDLVARALGKAGISQKAAAIDMGIDPGLLSAQLSAGSGKHLSWLRLGRLPAAFWTELIPMLAEWHALAFGTNEQAQQDALLGARVREVFQLARGER